MRMHPLLLIPLLLATAAASASALEAGTTRRSLSSGGLTRSYLLHVPRRLDTRMPAPLVLVFHGYGGSGKSMEQVTGFSDLADDAGFIVAYPDALDHDRTASWLDTSTGMPVDGNDALIGDLIDAVGARCAVDPRRVFATGMSQGGGMAYFAAATFPERIAAIAPVVVSFPTGMDVSSLWPARPMPVLMMNGTEDPLVPYLGGPGIKDVDFVPTPALARLLADLDGCTGTPTTVAVPNTARWDGCTAQKTTFGGGSQGSEVVLYTVNGGGHTWPDSRIWLPGFLFGATCKDFDGTQVIWDFFVRHPMPAHGAG